jgi:hypothetical protein
MVVRQSLLPALLQKIGKVGRNFGPIQGLFPALSIDVKNERVLAARPTSSLKPSSLNRDVSGFRPKIEMLNDDRYHLPIKLGSRFTLEVFEHT